MSPKLELFSKYSKCNLVRGGMQEKEGLSDLSVQTSWGRRLRERVKSDTKGAVEKRVGRVEGLARCRGLSA